MKRNTKESYTIKESSKWVIIITILISLLGGVPGIISILDYFNKKPQFKYSLLFSAVGKVKNGDLEEVGIFISGRIINDGEKPLFPQAFGLKIYKDDSTIIATSVLIDTEDPLIFNSDSKTVSFEKKDIKDLQLVKSIPPGSEVSGGLMFFVNGNKDAGFQNPLKCELMCVDQNNKKYKSEFELNTHGTDIGTPNRKFTDPRTGAKSVPKDSIFK